MKKIDAFIVYNNMGDLTAVYESGTLKASYTYDTLGRLTKTTNTNGTTEENTYNLAGLITSTINKKGADILSQYDYTYYYDGKQHTKKEPSKKETSIYDGQGQLVKVTGESSVSENTTLEKAVQIAMGVPTSIRINTASQARYFAFTPTTTGTYTIASTDCSGDPYGYLYSSNGTQLAYNDDGNGNLNFKIEYTLQAGTRYIIGAKMYSTRIGDYTLTVTPPDNTASANAATIQAGNPTSVGINTANQMRYFRFKPAVTGTYIIASTNNSGDPYGYLYSANGTQLTYNDDSNSSYNFKIEYILTAGTEYIIGARMYSSGTGSYTLTVTPPDNTDFANAITIQAKTSASVSIGTSNQVRYFRFTPDITGTYIIASTNRSGDPYGYLYSSTGTQLTYNDDGNGDLNFRIEYTLTAGTPYVIGAKMYSSGTGSYTLSVTPPSGEITVQEYTYDADGNRKNLKETKNGAATETVYTYDKNNRLNTEKTGTQATITYSYDANGNMTGKTDGTVQTFDDLNRMTSYKKGGTTTTTTYTYYPDDMRKSKKVGTAVETTHVWLDDEIALDLNGTLVTSSYIHGQKLITSTYGWYLYNAHGDVTALANSSGNIIKDYEYDSFGIQNGSVDAADNNPYRYCGEYYDNESGYTYLRARYYDPANGRFVSEDSALDGDNWYVYCGNDPLNHIDPSGLVKFHIGKPKAPSYSFDNDFPYASKKGQATFGDHINWAKWGTALTISKAVGKMPEANATYSHYRSAKGSSMYLNYDKANREETIYWKYNKSLIEKAQNKAYNQGKKEKKNVSFNMYSTKFNIPNGNNQNWQKAIGAHDVWANCTVKKLDGKKYSMTITISFSDMYNFNRGAKDIGTRASDNENGRFEELGWARSFETYGSITREISWTGKKANTKISNPKGQR